MLAPAPAVHFSFKFQLMYNILERLLSGSQMKSKLIQPRTELAF